MFTEFDKSIVIGFIVYRIIAFVSFFIDVIAYKNTRSTYVVKLRVYARL